MVQEYKLVGLEKVQNRVSATLEFNEQTFKAPIEGAEDRQKALFDYCKGDWSSHKIAEISCEKIINGFPVNPIVKSIRIV